MKGSHIYRIILGAAVPFFLAAMSTVAASRRGPAVVVPNAVQQAWAEAEIGVIIHFDMPTFCPNYQWRRFGTHPAASVFNPSRLDTDQWLAAARALGANYAVLVAKHCSGFSLWPTAAHDYSIRQSPYKGGRGDIVREFVASCCKYGIKPGLYASTTANGYLWVDNPGYVQKGGPVTQEQYNHIVTQQLTELWTNYGPLFEIWFDGGVLTKAEGGADILSLVKRLQPQAVAFQGPFGHPNLVRWVGNEEGTAPDPCWATADVVTKSDGTRRIEGMHGDPLAPYWCPGEADFTLRQNSAFQGGWFWHDGQDNRLFSVSRLMEKYETSVGRNTNMLVGIVVDTTGRVPAADFSRLAEFGREIDRRYGHPDKQTAGRGHRLTLYLDSLTEVDRVVLQEDIRRGERVLTFTLSGLTPDGWQVLASGTNIGHKRILRFAPRYVLRLRLDVTAAKARPFIARLAAYHRL